VFHIIDDDDVMCHLIEQTIRDADYDCLHFYSAEAYLKFMQTRSFTAPIGLITDYLMPKMNGLELADAVHKQYPEQAIILLSGLDKSDPKLLSLHQFDSHLSKPLQPETLLSLLNGLFIKQLFPSSKLLSCLNPRTDIDIRRPV